MMEQIGHAQQAIKGSRWDWRPLEASFWKLVDCTSNAMCGADSVMEDLQRFAPPPCLPAPPVTEVVPFQLVDPSHGAPWADGISAATKACLASMQVQWYRAWCKVRKESVDLLFTEFCFGLDWDYNIGWV